MQALPPSSGFEVLAQIIIDLLDEINTLNGKVSTAYSINTKPDMAEVKKKVEKIEKRAETQKHVEQPRNVPRTAVIPKFREITKSPQGMIMEKVIKA